jgi:hypothetical protein
MKKKRDATDEGKRKKKKAKGADEEEWDSDGTSDDDDDANDEDDEGPSTPVRRRGAKSKEKAQAAPRAAGGEMGDDCERDTAGGEGHGNGRGVEGTRHRLVGTGGVYQVCNIGMSICRRGGENARLTRE